PSALVAIATEQAKAGDRAAAKATCGEALEMILQEQEGTGKAGRLQGLVEALASVGELEVAKVAIEAFKNHGADKCSALVALARAEAKAGDKAGARASLSEARAAAKEIRRRPDVIKDDPARLKDEAFRAIAVAQVEQGDIKDSLATVAAHDNARLLR